MLAAWESDATTFLPPDARSSGLGLAGFAVHTAYFHSSSVIIESQNHTMA